MTKVQLISELRQIALCKLENPTDTQALLLTYMRRNGITIKSAGTSTEAERQEQFFRYIPKNLSEFKFTQLCEYFIYKIPFPIGNDTICVIKLHDDNVTVIEPLHYTGSPTDDEPTGTGEGAYNPGAQDTFTVLKKMVQSDPNISSQFKSAMGL